MRTMKCHEVLNISQSLQVKDIEAKAFKFKPREFDIP